MDEKFSNLAGESSAQTSRDLLLGPEYDLFLFGDGCHVRDMRRLWGLDFEEVNL